MTTIHDLPPEVISQILSELPYPTDRRQPDLYHAALVSRAWSQLALQELYLDLAISPESLERFCEGNYAPAFRTRSLNLLCESPAILERVLNRCTGVKELSLFAGSANVSLDWGSLNHPSLAGLKALGLPFSGRLLQPHLPVTFPFQLSSLYLQSLESSAHPLVQALFRSLNHHPTLLDISWADFTNTYQSLVPHFPIIAKSLSSLYLSMETLYSDLQDNIPDTTLLSILPTLVNLHTLKMDFFIDKDFEQLVSSEVDAEFRLIGDVLVALANYFPPSVQLLKLQNIRLSHFPYVHTFLSNPRLVGIKEIVANVTSLHALEGTEEEEVAAKATLERLGVRFVENDGTPSLIAWS
ncbi:hypothetical protein P7C70_g8329, partial [Phenoliferia sp. Uapishka_3]